MSEVTRFDKDMDGSMEPTSVGRWVRSDDYDALAARLAEVEAMLTKRDAHLATYKAMLDETRIQESARRGGELAAVQRAEAAEARVRELEHALRRASERLSWLRDHHCSSEFARGQAKMAADECWRVQAGERATASAGGGQ